MVVDPVGRLGQVGPGPRLRASATNALLSRGKHGPPKATAPWMYLGPIRLSAPSARVTTFASASGRWSHRSAIMFA